MEAVSLIAPRTPQGALLYLKDTKIPVDVTLDNGMERVTEVKRNGGLQADLKSARLPLVFHVWLFQVYLGFNLCGYRFVIFVCDIVK